MEPVHRQKPPRLAEVFRSLDAPLYFVTFCTWQRQRVLLSESVHQAFQQYAQRGIAEYGVAVGRYVIMPEHVHLFVCGGCDFDLGLWVRGLKRAMAAGVAGTATTTTTGVAGTATTTTGVAGMATTPATADAVVSGSTPRPLRLWQPGFFDHLLRNGESYEQKWHYVRENPVRAGLVARAEDWLYQGEIVAIDRV